MARKINDTFLDELAKNSLKPILDYVKYDDTLDMELRGDSVIIYYRGGKILEIKEEAYEFIGLDKDYLLESKSIEAPSLTTFEDYFPKAKHVIDYYVVKKRNHLWEKEIQQRIVQENNYSQNSLSTDYFIIDIEYQDIGRADIVALQWISTTPARKLQNNYKPIITLFEVKQGKDSISGSSGIQKHYNDFQKFIANPAKVENFISDMAAVFQQKRELGLIRNMETYKLLTKTDISPDIEFVFLLANYDSDSTTLKNELKEIGDCNFICANPMGYGLYKKNIINKEKFIKLFL